MLSEFSIYASLSNAPKTHLIAPRLPSWFSGFSMDWRAISRSRSRVSMDWRANSVSRSRSRAPGSIRLDFDAFDQNEAHSRALLANLEEESAVPTTAASAGGLPIHRSDGEHQQEPITNSLEGVSSCADVASAIPVPASNGSSSQSLLSLRLQGLQKLGEMEGDSERRASVSQPQHDNSMPSPQFQPPSNPFQNPQYNALFMPSSLPTFPHIADTLSGGLSTPEGGANNPVLPPTRALSHAQLGVGRQRKTSFDHTVAVHQGELSRSDANQKPLSPVLSSSSLVRA